MNLKSILFNVKHFKRLMLYIESYNYRPLKKRIQPVIKLKKGGI